MINWSLLNNYADPGTAFQQGIQAGAQRRQQIQSRNALAAYARDPTNPQAHNALLGADPATYMQLQQRQAMIDERSAGRKLDADKARREALLAGARIIREVQPKDDAGWQQVLAIGKQWGLPLENVPQTFDPNYVQQIISTADALSPEKPQTTAMQQNYEFLKSRNPDLAEEYLRRQAAEPPMMVNNGDGTITIIPRHQTAPTGATGGPQPGQVVNGYRFKGGNPNDRSNWEQAGGPGVSPGNFP